MKNKLTNFVLTLSTLFLFSSKAFSTVTMTVNAVVSSGHTLNACDPKPEIEAVESAVNALNYKWEWYKNGQLIWTDPANNLNYSNLGDHYSGEGVYRVDVRVNFTSTFSTSTTITVTGEGLYSAPALDNRVVSGDFDNDGKDDDIAGLYYYGSLNTKMHVWKSNGSALAYQGDNGWWSSPTYDATKIVACAAFDFDNDGFKDDIAAFYNYGGTNTEMHVFTSNGTSFSFASRWSSSTYDANKIQAKVVAGDFDRDGFYDDIAAFYAYDATNTSVHVWKSNGTSFPPVATWYSNGTYNANVITGKVVSGDFDKDGYEDDITVFYAYTSLHTAANIFSPNASSSPTAFTLVTSNAWSSTNAAGSSMVYTTVSGDFDRDGFKNDIAIVYYDNATTTRILVWKGNGTTLAYQGDNGWWSSSNYNQTKVRGRVIAGNFNNDFTQKSDDIVAIYDYGFSSTAAHVFLATGFSSFSYQGDNGFWRICSGLNPLVMANETEVDDAYAPEIAATTDLEGELITVYPNPSTGKFFVSSLEENTTVEIHSLAGTKVYSDVLKGGQGNQAIDLSHLGKGIYMLSLANGKGAQQLKIIIE